MTDHATMNLHPHSNEWRLHEYLGEAELGNAQCLNHLSHVVRALAGEPDVRAALSATMEAHQAALESKAALVGVRKFWGYITPRVMKHPRILGGTALAAFAMITVAWLWWPASASAGVNNRPEPTASSAEVQAMKLIEAEKYLEAKQLLNDHVPIPRKWQMLGELELMQGNVAKAQLWFEQAAHGGDDLAREQLNYLGKE